MKVCADMTRNLERFQNATRLGGLFLGWADSHVVTVGTGNCTRNEDHTIFWTDGDDLEVLNSAAGGTHVTGHLLVLPNATWGRAATNGSRPAVHHGAVGHLQTTESVALDRTLETATLGLADHVDPLAFRERFETWMNGWNFSAVCEAEFLDETLWRRSGLLEDAESGLGNALLLLIAVTDLNGGVTVGFRSLDLEYGVTGNINDGDRDHDAGLLVEQAGHTDFFAEEAE